MGSQLKKYWLLSSSLYFIALLVDAFIGDPDLHFNITFGKIELLIPFGYLFLESLNFAALFLFSYRKNGTALLTLNMLLNLFRIYTVLLPLLYWNEISVVYANREGQLLLDSLISALYLSIFLQWFLFSFKLRTANKFARKNEISPDSEQQKAM